MKNIKLVSYLSVQHESLVWNDWMVEFMIWAISLVVRFIFQGVCADQLDRFYNWTLELVPSEALAIDSILHLFCLLVDPYTNPTMVVPIDILFKMVVEHKVALLQKKVCSNGSIFL